MLTVLDFTGAYPQFAFDFSIPLRSQTRITDTSVLADLPEELLPITSYTKGGYMRANQNQTRTHRQCGTCHRVLRNDKYWNSAGMLRVNVITTYCIECATKQNDERYEAKSEGYKRSREAIWRYIAPKCVICGFDRHPAAMDMHHTGEKEHLLSQLIAKLAAAPLERNAELLIGEAEKCLPLCSNCHRLLHAGEVDLPSRPVPPSYDLVELVQIARVTQNIAQPWQLRLLKDARGAEYQAD